MGELSFLNVFLMFLMQESHETGLEAVITKVATFKYVKTVTQLTPRVLS